MSRTHVLAAPCEAAEQYLSRIETHLVRLAQRHDPMGHLFAVERLARAARAEWWAAQREAGQARPVAK